MDADEFQARTAVEAAIILAQSSADGSAHLRNIFVEMFHYAVNRAEYVGCTATRIRESHAHRFKMCRILYCAQNSSSPNSVL
jgi:2-methylcitrate dehydratase PrpD